MATPLISTSTRVEVPYITVVIGDYSFGVYSRKNENVKVNGKYYSTIRVTYPNYIKSLNIQKINGKLNNYTLTLEYPITENDDPNLIDKVLSSVSKSRKIVFTYGDCATPSFMYRNEEALITKVTSNLDVANSKITYQIQAVSTALGLQAGVKTFPRKLNVKPSDVIKELIKDKTSGIQEIFYGMHDLDLVLQQGLIPGDDKTTDLECIPNSSVLDYLTYLVESMSSINDSSTSTRKTVRYVLTVHDDTSNIFNGPYFKISKVQSNLQADTSIDYYTIDIGYPNKDLVSNFSVNNNEAYSILYDYSQKLNFSDYVYRIGDGGSLDKIYSPALTNSKQLMRTTELDRTWWAQMTQYPITAQITIKGLLRAAILMSYIRVNIYFYGRKHNASGVYVITRQEDTVDESGYKTTLNLTRVGGVEVDN